MRRQRRGLQNRVNAASMRPKRRISSSNRASWGNRYRFDQRKHIAEGKTTPEKRKVTGLTPRRCSAGHPNGAP